MWAVIKFDKKQFELLKRDFNKKYSKTAPIFSLHDCLITTEDFASELKKTFEVVLNRELANKPMTKINRIGSFTKTDKQIILNPIAQITCRYRLL